LLFYGDASMHRTMPASPVVAVSTAVEGSSVPFPVSSMANQISEITKRDLRKVLANIK
jgi:hypothetical protein